MGYGGGAPFYVYKKQIADEEASHQHDVSVLNLKIKELEEENNTLKKRVKELEEENEKLKN